MSRPTKLTPELTERVCNAIMAGNYAKISAQMAGIAESTFYEWLAYARVENPDPIYVEFAESVERAEATAEVGSVARIKQAADNGTWQAATWLLERKHFDRWGRNDKVRQEISGPDGTPVTLSLEEVKESILAFLNEGDDGEVDTGTDTEPTEA